MSNSLCIREATLAHFRDQQRAWNNNLALRERVISIVDAAPMKASATARDPLPLPKSGVFAYNRANDWAGSLLALRLHLSARRGAASRLMVFALMS